MAWLAVRNRLSTRDRMQSWGVQIPPLCLLCALEPETKQHLFFDCEFSKEVWLPFIAPIFPSPPSDFEALVRWVKTPTRDSNDAMVLRLAFQACIYMIWKERNARLHSASSRSSSSVREDIHRTLRAKLDSLSRLQRAPPGSPSFLTSWFRLYSS